MVKGTLSSIDPSHLVVFLIGGGGSVCLFGGESKLMSLLNFSPLKVTQNYLVNDGK